MTDLNNKRVLVLGAGRDGVAAAQFIYHTYPNARLAIADTRNVIMPLENIKTLFEDAYPNSLADWDVVVVSPGIKPSTPLLKTARYITTATNLFLEHCTGTVIGVTGSKGKSTTAAVIYSILNKLEMPAHLVGNIGTPALTELRENNSKDDIFVFEMSSYMTSRLEQAPDIAVITTLFPEHQDYHGSTEQYYTDKCRIAEIQTKKQHLIYNSANEELAKRVAHFEGQKYPYPTAETAYVQDGMVWYQDQVIIDIEDIPLDGEHNVLNVMGAITACMQLGLDQHLLTYGIAEFVSLPHRLQNVGTYNDITFYNDSLSTAPEATIAALEAVPNVKTLFLGGQDRGYEFTELAQKIIEAGVEHIVLFTEGSGAVIRKELDAAGYEGDYFEYPGNMRDAVEWAYTVTPAGSVCMLSCASPSYGIFLDYQDRGNRYTGAIVNIAHGIDITYTRGGHDCVM